MYKNEDINTTNSPKDHKNPKYVKNVAIPIIYSPSDYLLNSPSSPSSPGGPSVRHEGVHVSLATVREMERTTLMLLNFFYKVYGSLNNPNIP